IRYSCSQSFIIHYYKWRGGRGISGCNLEQDSHGSLRYFWIYGGSRNSDLGTHTGKDPCPCGAALASLPYRLTQCCGNADLCQYCRAGKPGATLEHLSRTSVQLRRSTE